MKRLISLLLCISLLACIGMIAPHAEEQQYLFKDKYIEQNIAPEERSYFTDNMYRELYYHYSPSGEIDWALIYAVAFTASPWFVSAELNGYVIESSDEGYPFSFGYGIYDVASDRFIDVIEAAETGRYPQLKEHFHYGRLIGDVDADGDLTIVDATVIQRRLADMDVFPESDEIEGYPLGGKVPRYYSDVDCDGERTVLDATKIQRKLVDLDVEPDYIKGIGNTVDPVRETGGEAVEYTALEQRLNDDPSSMRAAYRNAVIKSAAEFADYTGTTSDTYNDEFFADHALYAVSANVSDNIGAFSVKAMTFDGATLYPEFSFTGYDRSRSAGYELHEQFYEIPRGVAEQVQAIVPMEDTSLLYPVYNTFFTSKKKPSSAKPVGYTTIDSGVYTGSLRSLPAYNSIANTIVTSPYQLKDFLGIEDERYDNAYFEDHLLYAAVLRGISGKNGSEYAVKSIDYLDGVLYVGYQVKEITPNDKQHRFVLCEFDRSAVGEINNVQTYQI